MVTVEALPDEPSIVPAALPAENLSPGLTSIIILTCNQLAYTQSCVASIQRHTPEPHEIIFVDNCSSDGTLPWLNSFAAETANCLVVVNLSNLGFAAGCNQGLSIAKGKHLCLLNNDVVVTPGWLTGLLAVLSEEEGVGLVGPMTSAAGGPQQVPSVGYKDLDGLDDYAALFRARYRNRRVPCRRLSGFCLVFNRELLEKVGLLDEQFGAGNYEDDDFCYRSALAGYRNVIAADLFIHHYGSVSFQGNNIDYDQLLTRNRGLFQRKWQSRKVDETCAREILAVQTLERAAELVQAWDLEKAVSVLLDEGIRFFPEDPRCYLALAEYLLAAGRYQDVLDVVHSMPVAGVGIRHMLLEGEAALGLGDSVRAKDLAGELLERQPGEWRALTLLGLAAETDRDYLAAKAYFAEAIEKGATSGRPHTGLGLLSLRDGSGEGLDLLERGFLLSPLASSAGTAYHAELVSQQEFIRGIAVFRDALRFFPGSKGLRYQLIDLLIKGGHAEEALSEIQDVMVRYGVDDGILAAALDVCSRIEGYGIIKAPGLISLCMIVKNEAEQLPRCLHNLARLVDEIIVVDTGSSDGTADIARIFGAKVYDFNWTGDFSAARNYSLSLAKGKWLLVMDADELIAEREHPAIRSLLTEATSKGLAAYSLTTRNYTWQIDKENWQPNKGEYLSEEAGSGWVPSTKVRLFPNLPQLRFVNPVHELLEPSLEKSGIPVADAPFPVHHYGALGSSRLRCKAETYYQAGKDKLAASPGDIKAMFELAVQAAETGRHEEAVRLWQQVIVSNPDLAAAHFNLGFNFLQLGMFERAQQASEKALALQPKYQDALSNLCYALICQGLVEKALLILQRGEISLKQQLLLAIAYCCRGRAADRDAGLALFAAVAKRNIDFLPFLMDVTKKLITSQKHDIVRNLLETVIGGGFGDSELENELAGLARQY